MFTIDEIRAAHAKVKSGADFLRYVQDLIALGVTRYDTFVADGHSIFFGNDGYKIASGPKYGRLSVAGKSRTEKFIERLKAHQRGETNYPTFCNDAAANGVDHWTVDMGAMTCNYFDAEGKLMFRENIRR